MKSSYNLVILNLNEQLKFIDLEIDNQIKKCEKAIEIILTSIPNLKKIAIKSGFKSETDKIHFFKDLKPLLSQN